MFYSETLLSKTGPLARVWLAANLERKLSKNNILQSNIETSVNAIVDQGQAPMALRLSGQLLLGVVRIYSRKARYLLDDCNEALLKLKMAFRPGNVDLPANQSHTVNPASLTLPDALTEMDLLAPLPDPFELFSQVPELDKGMRDPTLLDTDPTDFLPASIEQSRNGAGEPMMLEDDGVIIDIDEGPTISSIEGGRDAPAPRPADEEFGNEPGKLPDDDVFIDIGEDEPVLGAEDSFNISGLGGDDDIAMGGVDEPPVPAPEEGVDFPAADAPGRPRESHSPLSDIRSSAERDANRAIAHDTSTFQPHDEPDEPDDETLRLAAQQQQPQRATKRRKVLQADADTELQSAQIRAQQDDRSRILKPASFLPRDPLLLALRHMQRSGGFVSNVLGDGRSRGWAPELRGVLSLEVVRKSGDLKRKRDSGVADVGEEEDDEEEGRSPPPRLEFEMDEQAEITAGGATALDLGADDDAPPPINIDEEDDDDALSPIPDNFDDTTAPLLHPADSGPVSLGTKHAVHLLREQFVSTSTQDPTSSSPSQGSVSRTAGGAVRFQDLLPEPATSRADATKMFFEVLVLATKDAIKVDQPTGPDALGAPIRIRAKRGLWGAWAEERAGGEIAVEEEEEGGGLVASSSPVGEGMARAGAQQVGVAA